MVFETADLPGKRLVGFFVCGFTETSTGRRAFTSLPCKLVATKEENYEVFEFYGDKPGVNRKSKPFLQRNPWEI